MPDGKRRGVAAGDLMPDVVLLDQNGEAVRLRDLVGKSALVVFFYPRDGAPVCTREACQFGERYQEFTDLTAEVIGISGDDRESHARFAARHHLPFRLLSDTDGEARRRFGADGVMGLIPGRVTYVVDRQGVVRHIYRSQLQAARHVREALSALQTETDSR